VERPLILQIGTTESLAKAMLGPFPQQLHPRTLMPLWLQNIGQASGMSEAVRSLVDGTLNL
jgi:hypothetical protein